MHPKTKTALRIAAAVLLGCILGVLYTPGSPGFIAGLLVGFVAVETLLFVIGKMG